jgi:cell division protein FtsZ
MTISLSMPVTHEMKPRISVVGVGGAGGNAVNNMITSHLEGVEFVACNTDAQALANCLTDRKIQLGNAITHGLGAGARPEVGRASAEESLDEILDLLQGSNMVFITAGMGGGTGTGAAPVIARAVRDMGILTVGVVTKPFHFEGAHRMRLAEGGLTELQQFVDTLIVIPNQNLFRLANERTTFAEAFQMADQVLHMGVRGVTDLMVMPGMINLDFADIRTVMSEMGKAMMGTGEAEGERRAIDAAEAAISNPLLDEVSMRGARGVLINITGGSDITLFEIDAAANRIREEVDPEANIIFGSTYDESIQGGLRVSVVATGIETQAERSRQAAAAEAAGSETQPAQAGGWFPHTAHRPQPYPQVQKPAARAAEANPTLHLRAASDGRQGAPADSSQGQYPHFVPPPAETTGYRGDPAQAAQGAASGYAVPRGQQAEERQGGLGIFQRMRGFARTHGLGAGGADGDYERPVQPQMRREPAMVDDGPVQPQQQAGQPGNERGRNATPGQDELGDIPAFLRKERVDS